MAWGWQEDVGSTVTIHVANAQPNAPVYLDGNAAAWSGTEVVPLTSPVDQGSPVNNTSLLIGQTDVNGSFTGTSAPFTVNDILPSDLAALMAFPNGGFAWAVSVGKQIPVQGSLVSNFGQFIDGPEGVGNIRINVNPAGTVIPPSSTSTSNGNVNGLCGSANGTTTSAAPTTNLCSSGTAGAVTGIGPWSWVCSGSGTGSNATSRPSRQRSRRTVRAMIASATPVFMKAPVRRTAASCRARRRVFLPQPPPMPVPEPAVSRAKPVLIRPPTATMPAASATPALARAA